MCGLASWFFAVPVSLWAWWQSRKILRGGRGLTSPELADARAVGVLQPERIRVLAVRRVPNPLRLLAAPIARFTRYQVFDPAGMTLGFGIFARSELEDDRLLLAHEFVHVAQYERFGGVLGFMRRYIFQCLADGYLEAALEIEARELSERTCS